MRSILERHQAEREHGHSALPRPPARRGSLLDPYMDEMRAILERYPDITAVRMHEKLEELGFEGGYTIVRERVKKLRPRPKVEPSRPLDYAPGRSAQQDWSPYNISFEAADDANIQCFALHLPFSKRSYVDFHPRSDLPTLMRSHVAAFEWFGGVPAEVVYDRQKTVVLRKELGLNIYNATFLRFATHYGFKPHALPPRSPKLKPGVERGFQDVVNNLFSGRSFRDLDDLRAQTRTWMSGWLDHHKHRSTGRSPLELFEEQERQHLLPLPAHPYDTSEIGYRVVDRYCYARWENTEYPVPYDYVLDVVVVRASADRVEIYGDDMKKLAEHPRMPREHRGRITSPTLHPEKKARRNIDLLMHRMGDFGEPGTRFAEGVCARQRYRGQHLAEAIELQARYARGDIQAALSRACAYRAFDAAVLRRILESTATPRELPVEGSAEAARERLHRALGRPGVPARAMRDYEAALRGDDSHEPEE